MAHNTPDYSGLQLSDRHDDLEVANKDSAYPEPVQQFEKVYPSARQSKSYPEAVDGDGRSYPEALGLGAAPLPPKYTYPPQHYHEVGDNHYRPDHQLHEDGLSPEKKQPRFSRRCWIVSGIIMAVLVIGAVVGAVVGVMQRSSDTGNGDSAAARANNTTDNSTAAASVNRSACRNVVCPQILAAAQASDQLMVFARGTDNNIWYNTATASGLSPWPASQKWTNLHGGPFLSQPHAVAWNFSTRISVVAVADPDHTARTQMWTPADATWEVAGWKNLAGKMTSAVTLCAVGGERLDFWAATSDSTVIAHNFLDRFKGVYWAPDLSRDWQGSADWKADPTSKGRPAVVCRYDDFGHDIVAYDGTGKSARYTSYSGGTAWTPIFALDSGSDGAFAGFLSDPVLLAPANDRLDFFGIGADKAMYYGAWSKRGGHVPLVNLGGSFQSVPSAVATRQGGRVDVVALGTGDTLLHRVLIDGRWSAEWEDLGVFGNSAPLAVNLTTSPETVSLFVLGTNNEMNQTVWQSDTLFVATMLWTSTVLVHGRLDGVQCSSECSGIKMLCLELRLAFLRSSVQWHTGLGVWIDVLGGRPREPRPLLTGSAKITQRLVRPLGMMKARYVVGFSLWTVLKDDIEYQLAVSPIWKP
ncbi:hypothetical protein QBC34DRAFT_456036 [Podospora aff. communis PSN243]|uniref:PLL-like beta propeller domain-containing protein n=1 Tax=Podospora aff. communis PSN243 TaxID=3040156 RepID=A0AAV9FWC4_9PEZI|nr:hypothetical protein QBC34DRAFT_456036 [Podospora aff. communis PSN243]